MSRITTVNNETANIEQRALFEAIHSQLGMVPNFLRVFAHSPDALKAFLGLHHIAGHGSLDAATRERIALALAQQNECEYCLSAHTAIGRKSGLNGAEIEANRAGTSQDAKAAVAVRFARALVEHKGEVTNAELQSMRDVGFSEADLVEVITHVGMNFMTNILGKASRVDVDFPKVTLKQAA
ncbi:carboxymuconolactone decarboxylase family protein [Methylomicrobium sp. wino1]|uniref:carboxymuconolactone decarboxylase family protein n=1 Tax=Methylotuvimicrobium sp. KM1 TaxID=3377707 RepID=UPI000F64C2C9